MAMQRESILMSLSFQTFRRAVLAGYGTRKASLNAGLVIYVHHIVGWLIM